MQVILPSIFSPDLLASRLSSLYFPTFIPCKFFTMKNLRAYLKVLLKKTKKHFWWESLTNSYMPNAQTVFKHSLSTLSLLSTAAEQVFLHLQEQQVSIFKNNKSRVNFPLKVLSFTPHPNLHVLNMNLYQENLHFYHVIIIPRTMLRTCLWACGCDINHNVRFSKYWKLWEKSVKREISLNEFHFLQFDGWHCSSFPVTRSWIGCFTSFFQSR